MSNQYQWPKADNLYPNRDNKSYALKRFRYHLRSLLHSRIINQFEIFINQHSNLITLLNQRANYSYPVAHRFLDKRFNAKQRLATVCDNLQFLPEKLTQLSSSVIENTISFGQIIPDFEMVLTLNNYQPMEGFLALELRHCHNNQLVYLLTFGKIEQALLIGVIQGPNFEGSKEIVKQLTKNCYGLRPAYLMVEAMKALTSILGYDQLWGIPHQYQNKSRWVQSKRYVVDYDIIFAESGGKSKEYWHLPLTLESKPLDTIPSKKRSMYRKRYAMLNALRQAMQTALT